MLDVKKLRVTHLRVLKALADGGAQTLGIIGQVARLAGGAGGATLADLVEGGLVARQALDIDGATEIVYSITERGEEVAAEQDAALPPLAERREADTKLKTKSLVPLFGSNRTLAPEVGKLLDGCSWVGVPFAGSLAELVYIRARSVAINDLHAHIINLAMTAADDDLGPRLWRRLSRLAFHPLTLKRAQLRCAEREGDGGCGRDWESLAIMPDLDWATDYFTCAWMARSESAGTRKEFDAPLAFRWNAGGGDGNVRFRSAARGLREWRVILRRCSFSCLDAFVFLDKCKDDPDTGVFCDPPFPGPGANYKVGFSDDAHVLLAGRLLDFKNARVVCRFYDVDMVRDLYPETEWTWRLLRGRKQSNDAAPEVLLVRNG